MVITAYWHRNNRRNKEVLFICPVKYCEGQVSGGWVLVVQACSGWWCMVHWMRWSHGQIGLLDVRVASIGLTFPCPWHRNDD